MNCHLMVTICLFLRINVSQAFSSLCYEVHGDAL
jgi:hypothetical protein